MAPLPKGINYVGFFSLFASVGLAAFAALVYGASDSLAQYGYAFPIAFKLIIASWVVFALAGIVLSSMLLGGFSSKRLWFAFLSYWILLLAFWVGFDLRDLSGTWRAVTYGFAVEIFGPIVYSACGIAYFLTRKPKRYFHFENSGIQTDLKGKLTP
ncbi:MAG: hypothetical protein ABSD92_11095 [Candidatus Bathyarchaeia archaeon]|jgi:hypothetical protein